MPSSASLAKHVGVKKPSTPIFPTCSAHHTFFTDEVKVAILTSGTFFIDEVKVAQACVWIDDAESTASFSGRYPFVKIV